MRKVISHRKKDMERLPMGWNKQPVMFGGGDGVFLYLIYVSNFGLDCSALGSWNGVLAVHNKLWQQRSLVLGKKNRVSQPFNLSTYLCIDWEIVNYDLHVFVFAPLFPCWNIPLLVLIPLETLSPMCFRCIEALWPHFGENHHPARQMLDFRRESQWQGFQDLKLHLVAHPTDPK